MSPSFVLRAEQRGFDRIVSTGESAGYVGGHPDAFITRWSSFNFHDYQEGRPGFGTIRVFGDEAFHNPGCSYSMHRHHNFIICAFVLSGRLLHVNTLGQADELGSGDFYAFSAGSGGLHAEINLQAEPMQAIYLWLTPDQLLLPPSYGHSHFDAAAGMNRFTTLVGGEAAEGGLPIPQDARVSRLVTDAAGTHRYRPRTDGHGVYAFVLEGDVRIDGTRLGRRDSTGLSGVEEIVIETDADPTDVLLVETVMN